MSDLCSAVEKKILKKKCIFPRTTAKGVMKFTNLVDNLLLYTQFVRSMTKIKLLLYDLHGHVLAQGPQLRGSFSRFFLNHHYNNTQSV